MFKDAWLWASDIEKGKNHGFIYGDIWIDKDANRVYLGREGSGLRKLKELQEAFLVDYRYKYLPQLFNLYVYHELRRLIILDRGRCAGMLGGINIELKNEIPGSSHELDVIFLDQRNHSMGIVECTVSTSKREDKESKLKCLEKVLKEKGFSMMAAEVITPSDLNELDKIADRLAEGVSS